MAAVIPVVQGITAAIGAAKAIGGLFKKDKPQQPAAAAAPALSYDQAVAQARTILDPLWQEKVDQTIQGMTNDQISRGFFGQLPGAAQLVKGAAKVRGAQASATADLAQKMVEASRQYGLQQQGLAQQQQALNQQAEQSGLGSLAQFSNMFGLMDEQAYNQTGVTYRYPQWYYGY